MYKRQVIILVRWMISFMCVSGVLFIFSNCSNVFIVSFMGTLVYRFVMSNTLLDMIQIFLFLVTFCIIYLYVRRMTMWEGRITSTGSKKNGGPARRKTDSSDG